MLPTQFLYFISIIIWLLPPIRQYRTKLFFFFLILAVMDPISFAYFQIFNKTIPFGFYLFANFLLFISLMEFNSIKKNLFIIISSGLLFLLIIIFANFTTNQNLIILTAIQFLILATVLKKFIVNFALNKYINLFQLVLVFYLLTVITKFLNLLTSFADATAFFIITSIAQIIFGLYFSIFRENNA